MNEAALDLWGRISLLRVAAFAYSHGEGRFDDLLQKIDEIRELAANVPPLCHELPMMCETCGRPVGHISEEV